MLDIFNDNAFGTVSLTDAINELKYVPGRIGQLNIFSEKRITTTIAVIEKRANQLVLIPPTPRGGPGVAIPKVRANARPFIVPHFEINDAIMADEVQNVRMWGTESQLETVMGRVAERMDEHNIFHSVTEEYSRIGAVKGIVTYADGSTLNLFTEFGITQHAEVDFDLDNAAPAAGALRLKAAGVVRDIANALGGVPFSGVVAECGDTFFDQLMAHVEVRNSYLNTDMASVLRSGYILPNGNKIFSAFEFGGIVWENYRGSVGGTSFVAATKCHIFPIGVPGLFRQYLAPADYIETVNTLGQRLYMKQFRMQNDKGIALDSQTNQLNICTRPEVLIQGKNT